MQGALGTAAIVSGLRFRRCPLLRYGEKILPSLRAQRGRPSPCTSTMDGRATLAMTKFSSFHESCQLLNFHFYGF